MERKEAIRILKGDTLFNSREKREALEMAISSLETDEAYQLEYEKPTTKNDLGVDCISRADAIKGLGEQPYVWTDSDFEIQQLADWKIHKEMLENLPSVTPQEPKKGHWIAVTPREHNQIFQCSECKGKCHCIAVGNAQKWWKRNICTYDYCPRCGAKMEVETPTMYIPTETRIKEQTG